MITKQSVRTLILGLTISSILAGTSFAARKSSYRAKARKPHGTTLASATVQSNVAAPKAAASAAPAAQTSTASQSLGSKIVAGYYGDFNGPGVGEWGYLSKNPNPGDGTSPLYLYNVLLLGYKLSDTTRIQIQPRFNWTLVGGQRVAMLDTRVGFNFGGLGSLGPVSLDAVSAQIEVPTSDGSFRRSFIFGPRLTEFVSASFGRFGLSSFNIQRVKFFADGALNSWDVYFNPAATYQIGGPVTARLGYEWQIGQFSQTEAIGVMSADIKAQVVVDISKKFSVEPYVKMFPWDGLYQDNTLFGFEVNGVL